MKNNENKNLIKTFYPDYDFNSNEFNKIQKNKVESQNIDMETTLKSMEENYKKTISNQNNSEKTKTQNINNQQIQSLLKNENDTGNMINFLMQNLSNNYSGDKFKLIQELISMIGKNQPQKKSNKSIKSEEIDTTNFVKTSDFILD